MPYTKADSTHLALPHDTQEKHVLKQALTKVLIKVIEDTKPNQTSGRQVESMNAVGSSRACNILAV
jgi:hypothetical protein